MRKNLELPCHAAHLGVVWSQWFSEVAQFLKLHCFLPLFDEGFQPHFSHMCPCACASREQNLATNMSICSADMPE